MSNLGARCPALSIQSFPVGLGITLTPEILTGIREPLTFQFDWGKRTTPAQFLNSENGLIDEPLTTTVTYNNITYTLESVQLVDPTHQKWIVPYVQQVRNKEDIILTFSYSSLLSTAAQYLVFVIPILQTTATAGDPPYLKNFSDPTKSGQETSIVSIIPARPAEPFIYYWTCCQGYSSGAPPQNIMVTVSVNGLYVSSETMMKIKNTYKKSSVSGVYGPYIPPLSVKFNYQMTISSFQIFTNYVHSTTEILSPTTPGTQSGPLPDEVIGIDKYQCVPLDPDKQIDASGNLTIDPNTGKPLTTVQDDRADLRSDVTATVAKIDPKVFNKYVSIVLGIFLGCILLGILMYFLLGAFVGPRVVGDGATFYQRQVVKISNVPAYTVIGILAGLIGLTIGMFIKK